MGKKVNNKNGFIKIMILFFVVILIISGCGKKESLFKSEKDVLKYLSKEYKNESFKILSHEKITLSDERNCYGESLEGNSYKVKSEDSGIEFTVKDLYYYNLVYCSVIKYDDYLNKTIESYSSGLDKRIDITYSNRAYAVPTLGISLSDFESEKEAIVEINEFSTYLNKKYPYINGYKYVNFRICKGSLMSSKCNNITTIDAAYIEKIIDLVNGLKGV